MPTPVSPSVLIRDLNRRIDRALTHRDHQALAEAAACSKWLADLSPEVAVRQLEARANAALRFIAGGRRHG
jgi:hypothetical protein